MNHELPDFREWSIAAVRLLKGAVDADEPKLWHLVLTNVSVLEDYFGRIGLQLIVNETEGMAYLRQLSPDEAPAEYEQLPRLFRTTRMSYGQTLLCVLLREEYRRFEEEDLRNTRCVVEQATLFEQWRAFFPSNSDDVKLQRDMLAALRKLEDIGFVRPFAIKGTGKEPGWEIRRILKARLTAADLERLKARLEDYAEQQAATAEF